MLRFKVKNFNFPLSNVLFGNDAHVLHLSIKVIAIHAQYAISQAHAHRAHQANASKIHL